MNIRVYYEDTDAGGIVYHAGHLRFAERGRTEFLRSVGFENTSLMDREGILFVVRRLEIDYLAPARLDDWLEIRTSITELRRTSFVMNQSIFRDGAEICRMSVIVVAVNRAGKPAAMPESMRAVFEQTVEHEP